MTNIFQMPIGDWSRDGHGECNYYTIETALDLNEVREAHFKIKEVTGLDIHEICNEYEDNYVTMETLKDLERLGFDYSELDWNKDGCYMKPEDLRDIWILLLNKVNPKLKLKIAGDIDTLSFYGFDEKGRHIGFVGYGCF